MGPTLSRRFRDVVGLGSLNIVAKVLHGRLCGPPNKVMDRGEWSICRGGALQGAYCIFWYIIGKGAFVVI